MNFSASQWLCCIIVDVIIKFLLVTVVGLFVSYGLISIELFVTPALALSLLHFVCLFLGSTAVVMLEPGRIRLPPAFRFTAGVIVANVLFVAVLVAWFWPGPRDIPRTADGPLVAALTIAATNLVSILAGAAAGCRRLRREARSGESAPGS